MEHMRASELYLGTTDETQSPFLGLAFQSNPKGIQVVKFLKICIYSNAPFYFYLYHSLTFSCFFFLQEQSAQFFYDMNAPSDSRRGKRGRYDDGGQVKKKRERPVFDQGKCKSLFTYLTFIMRHLIFIMFVTEKCWFCLASPQVEKHLVISIGTEVCYLILTLFFFL